MRGSEVNRATACRGYGRFSPRKVPLSRRPCVTGAAFAARLDGWIEDENRVALLCLLQRELEHVRIREAVDRRRLFRGDLARQRRLRADRLGQRPAQLLLEVGAVEVDDVLRRRALLR